MLRSYCKELGEFYNTIDGLPDNPKQYSWTCPHCDWKMSHVKESNRIEHFRHYPKSKCVNYEPETPEHLLMKQYCYQLSLGQSKERQLEYRVGDQIIDVYLESKTGEKIAIECQCSSISVDKLLERTKKYAEKGFYTIWILGSNNFGELSMYYPTKKVSAIEKALYNIYGEVYYFDTYGYISPYSWHIYALEFSDYRNPDTYRLLKNTMRTLKVDDLTSKLTCTDWKGYKIAEFKKKELKTVPGTASTKTKMYTRDGYSSSNKKVLAKLIEERDKRRYLNDRTRR